MGERLEITLFNRQQAWADMQAQLFPFLKQVLQAKAVWVLTVTRRKRSGQQNRRYWGNGVLAQVARQAVVGGRRYDAEHWHEFFKQRFIGVEELPFGRVVAKSSTSLSTAEFCDFSDAVEAYAATELGVRFEDLMPHAK